VLFNFFRRPPLYGTAQRLLQLKAFFSGTTSFPVHQEQVPLTMECNIRLFVIHHHFFFKSVQRLKSIP
jgi:hypothetical protein